jgi:hypothetical protein
MTKEDLIEALNQLKIHPKHYAIGGELKDYAQNVEKLPNGKYAVYYLEKSEKNAIKYFDDEFSAFDELFDRYKKQVSYGLDFS